MGFTIKEENGRGQTGQFDANRLAFLQVVTFVNWHKAAGQVILFIGRMYIKRNEESL